MRPVFMGNLDYDTRHSELDRLFYRYGRNDRIDMQSGLPSPISSLLFFSPPLSPSLLFSSIVSNSI